MSKRYFKIDTGRYGGEVVMGTVTPEFVEYWRERDQDDLLSHILNLDWEDGDVDPDSPEITENGNVAWHDVEDLEHANGPYADNRYLVYEIELAPGVEYVNGELVLPEDWDYTTPRYEEISEYTDHGYENYVYGREAYTHDYDPESSVYHTPVMTVHSSEKGGFGEIYIETNGEDFDPAKLAIGVVETDLCEIIEAYWYEGRELVVDFDYADTNGKGMYASVGWMNPEWHDDASHYTHDSDYVQESLTDLFFDDGC